MEKQRKEYEKMVEETKAKAAEDERHRVEVFNKE